MGRAGLRGPPEASSPGGIGDLRTVDGQGGSSLRVHSTLRANRRRAPYATPAIPSGAWPDGLIKDQRAYGRSASNGDAPVDGTINDQLFVARVMAT